jgi:two-component system, OmpR family, response regulator
MAKHVLVIDDDPAMRDVVGTYLESHNYRVSLAADGEAMMRVLSAGEVDLLLLDLKLANEDGLELMRRLGVRSDVPIIVVTGHRRDETDRVVGLELGADDYLGKPFNPRELAARIRAVLRRAGTGQEEASSVRAYRFAGYTMEPETRRVVNSEGETVDLTGAEFDLLQVFLERPGRLLSRDQLLDLTQGRERDPFDRSVDVLMSRLRRKFGDRPESPLFKTVRNGGYQLTVRVETVDMPA